MKAIRHIAFFLLLVGAGHEAWARQVGLGSTRQPVVLNMGAYVQTFTDGGLELEEVSLPVSIVAPLGRNVRLQMRTARAVMSGTGLAEVAGMGDAQVGFSYVRRLGGASLILGVNANLPSGKRELAIDEFATSVVLGQAHYSFRMPSFGQGLTVSPGLTLAVPLTPWLVVGGGVSYVYKEGYRPRADMEFDYVPGPELNLTGGLDIRLNPRMSLSADATVTHYGVDQLGVSDQFQASQKVATTVQFRHVRGANVLRLVGRYRLRGQSMTLPLDEFGRPIGDALVVEAERTLPNQALVRLSYRFPTSDRLTLHLQADGRYFEARPASRFNKEAKQLLHLAFLPSFRINRLLTLNTRTVYTVGSFKGFEVGSGLAVRL